MYQYKYLRIDGGEVYFLGYRLLLTKSEYKIICRIAEAEKPMCAEGLVTSLGRRKITAQNAAVHICNINKKANAIGGRNLINCDSGRYYFNEFM